MKATYLLLAALVLSGCSQERLMEKKRLKAEALVKEAIETYPGIIDPVITTDTITLISPPVTIRERIGYSQSSVDSLRHICTDFLQAKDERIRELVARRMTIEVCDIDTQKFYRDPLDLWIWSKNGVLDVMAKKHVEALDTTTTRSTRVIQSSPCPSVETSRIKSQFWLGFIAGVVFVVLGAVFVGFMRGSNRFE